jgi:hypothetical protein
MDDRSKHRGANWRRTYFVQGELTQLIKIGRTNGTGEQRLKELQASSPDKLVLLKVVNRDIEKQTHIAFKAPRAHGEWFRPSPELLLFIEQLR